MRRQKARAVAASAASDEEVKKLQEGIIDMQEKFDRAVLDGEKHEDEQVELILLVKQRCEDEAQRKMFDDWAVSFEDIVFEVR